MDVELLQLAREAVAALQTGPPPNWAEVASLWVSAIVGFGQIGVIMWGLSQMNTASEQRNRQLDLMESAQREQAARQNAALEQQGEALRQQGEALRQQGEVLAELLRRTA